MNTGSSRYRALLTGADPTQADMEWLRQHRLEVDVRGTDLSESELARALVGKDAYILGGLERATAAALSTADDLKVIAFLGVGYHAYIDTAAATTAGIAVTNAPGANARAVAEFTIGLMLDAWRRITDLTMETKAGRWRESKGRNLHAKTLGIVGMGDIGTIVARIAANGFGMRVVYVSRTAKPGLEREIAARRVELSELVAEADVISLHASYGPQTERIIGEPQLAAVKPGAILINTSEANLVDPASLRTALLDGRLAAAAMDGYYIAPAPSAQDDPFGLMALSDNKFLVTPYAAGATEESFRAMLETNVESIGNLLSTGEDRRVVNPGFRDHAHWLPVRTRTHDDVEAVGRN
ncbi:D-isomer specific 2-hydroxyacid dehydrogenase [Nocardia sputorum]|uniref:2-hydroxyacid dehydrogenase n=1 Tax=Nocardia TaxID=1817 RepID=UPI00248FB759|nr:D-isomer specific 2-hydroxyacid dehydrogenase family protein [Nocardia sputorum]BDT95084.1 D-isomer specific 2-hydroxyacid dehydrogenase [Nocardia sputorum]